MRAMLNGACELGAYEPYALGVDGCTLRGCPGACSIVIELLLFSQCPVALFHQVIAQLGFLIDFQSVAPPLIQRLICCP